MSRQKLRRPGILPARLARAWTEYVSVCVASGLAGASEWTLERDARGAVWVAIGEHRVSRLASDHREAQVRLESHTLGLCRSLAMY